MSPPRENFRTLVAACDSWQAIVGAEDDATAAERILIGRDAYMEPPVLLIDDQETGSELVAANLYNETGVLAFTFYFPGGASAAQVACWREDLLTDIHALSGAVLVGEEETVCFMELQAIRLGTPQRTDIMVNEDALWAIDGTAEWGAR